MHAREGTTADSRCDFPALLCDRCTCPTPVHSASGPIPLLGSSHLQRQLALGKTFLCFGGLFSQSVLFDSELRALMEGAGQPALPCHQHRAGHGAIATGRKPLSLPTGSSKPTAQTAQSKRGNQRLWLQVCCRCWMAAPSCMRELPVHGGFLEHFLFHDASSKPKQNSP